MSGYWINNGPGESWYRMGGNARKNWECSSCGAYIEIGEYCYRFEPGPNNYARFRYTYRTCESCG